MNARTALAAVAATVLLRPEAPAEEVDLTVHRIKAEAFQNGKVMDHSRRCGS